MRCTACGASALAFEVDGARAILCKPCYARLTEPCENCGARVWKADRAVWDDKQRGWKKQSNGWPLCAICRAMIGGWIGSLPEGFTKYRKAKEA